MINFVLEGHTYAMDVQTAIQIFFPNRHYYNVDEMPKDGAAVKSILTDSRAEAYFYQDGNLKAQGFVNRKENADEKENGENKELAKTENKEENEIQEKGESKNTKKRTNQSEKKEKEEISTENKKEEEQKENEITALSKIDLKSKEFLEKIEQERKKQKQVPEDKMKLAHIVVAKNIVIAIGILLYFFLFKLAFITLEPVYFVTLMNAFSIITIIFTIIVFEIAYKKDSDVLAIHGIEMMFLAITTLLFKFVYMNYLAYFIRATTIIAILYGIYYAIKATRIYIKARKKFKNNTREIEEIVKTKK